MVQASRLNRIGSLQRLQRFQNVALKDAVLRGSDKPKGNQTQSEQNDQL
jgi:hypothetical protein